MTVRYERIGDTAVITIARPERRNAVDVATGDALRDAWSRFEDDESAAVGILTGAGDHFSAGADLTSLRDGDPAELAARVRRPEGFLGFCRSTVAKPTIAAVSGYCVAGGLEMALWCDLRVASETAVFGVFNRRWGVPLVDGGTQRLPRIVGLSRALDMVLTGRAVAADEAYRIGLVDRLVPAATELEAALDLGAVIAAYPQATVRSDRMALLRGIGTTLDEGLVMETIAGTAVLAVGLEGAGRFAAGEGRHGEGVPGE